MAMILLILIINKALIWRRNMRLRVDTNISFLSELMLWSLLSFLEKRGYINAMQEADMLPQILKFDNRSRYTARYIDENFASFSKTPPLYAVPIVWHLVFGRGLLAKKQQFHMILV